MSIIVDHPVTTLSKELVTYSGYCTAGTVKDVKKGDVFISTQGTSRGQSSSIIKKCFSDIVEQAESIQHLAERMIIIGSVGSDFPSWPGLSNTRLTYNIAKLALTKWAQGWNQSKFEKGKGITGMRIQICRPSNFKSDMGGDTGLEIHEVVKSIEYLISNPNVTEVSVRQ